jgi:hypothetical protein
MLVEQQCAFINYTRMEDCDRAIQLMDVRALTHLMLNTCSPLSPNGDEL